MKKSSFIALVLGTISGTMFAIGMCMALLPEWNAFQPGVIFGSLGLILGIVTVCIWRRMEGKAPVRVSGKNMLIIADGIAGSLLLGIGMCFCMVWEKLIMGIVIGLLGMALLISLVPLIKGFKD